MPEVLIVDDSVSVRKALEFNLLPHGLTVRSAASAEDALRALDEPRSPPDLVISDIVMPGMSGLDLCHELRARPGLDALPVLLISGVVDDHTTRQAQQAGATGLLKKPFAPGELLPAVRRALGEGPAPARPTAPSIPVPQEQAPAFCALLEQLAEVPGLLAAAAYDDQGAVLGQVGVPLAREVGQYARFYLGTASALGQHVQGAEVQTVQLEFAGRTVLLARRGDALYACLLREAGSAGLVKYRLRQGAS